MEQKLALLDPSMQVLRTSTISREAFVGHYLDAICALLPGEDAFPDCPGGG